GQQNLGTVIGKTGTTTDSKSGFFIGATTQYSLVVGMFVNDPNSKANKNNSLEMLGGGGFGGYWPAKIWNSLAESQFSSSPQTFSTNPSGMGSAWDMLGKVPKAKPVCSKNFHGHKIAIGGKGCPNPNQDQNGDNGNNGNNGANPTVTCDPNNDPNCQQNPDGTVSCDPNSDPNCQTVPTQGDPTATVTCDPNVDKSCQVNGDGTVTCDPNADPDCTTVGTNNSANSFSATPTVPTATDTVGGMALLLPGTLLLTRVTRRRKRRGREGRGRKAK